MLSKTSTVIELSPKVVSFAGIKWKKSQYLVINYSTSTSLGTDIPFIECIWILVGYFSLATENLIIQLCIFFSFCL